MSPSSFLAKKTAACTPTVLRFVAGLALLATPALAQVKLSQIYGAGGNSTSPITHDFIEIYNSGAPQDLTGWSVQYASSTGVFTALNTTALPSVILGTGQYLLVQEAIGTTVVAGQAPATPAPDATGAIAMSATDFKVALVNSIAFLPTGLPTYLANPSLVDFVGAGTANWNDTAAAGGAFLAANNSPAPSNQPAIYRRNCGAQDTNVSKDDWAVGYVNPRNTATALSGGMSHFGIALPATAEELQTVLLVSTPFACGSLTPDYAATVSVDASSIGAGAILLLDNGVAPDDLAGDGIYKANAVIAAGTTLGTKAMPVTLSGSGTGGGYISLLVTDPAVTPNNDNCASAAVVAIPSSTVGTVLGATVESNPIVSSTAPTGGHGSRRGVWYKVVGNGGTLTASMCGTLPVFDSIMFVMGGNCDGLTLIGANDDFCASLNASQVTWCSQLGADYYIFVGHFNGGAQTNVFTLNVTDAGPCVTAFPVTICNGVAGPYTENEPGLGMGSNEGCSSSPNLFTTIPTPGPIATVIRGTSRGLIGNRDFDDYRFQATVTDTMTVNLETFGAANGQVQINTLTGPLGVCPQTAVVGGNTGLFVTRCATGSTQTVTIPVTAGTWYTLNVLGGINLQVTAAGTVFGGIMPGGSTYQYKMSVTIGAPPANDPCSAASNLVGVGGTIAGNTTNATFEGLGSSCDATGKDVWYSFGPTIDAGTLNLNTCATAGLDTVISVFGSCGGAELVCNDDGGPACVGIPASVSWPMLVGETVKVRVSTKGGPGGNFSMAYQYVVPPPANDECATATVISGSGGFIADTRFATPITATALPVPSCKLTNGVSRDVWFQWTSTEPGLVNVDTCGASQPTGGDSVLTVYSGPCGALIEEACDDDLCALPNFASQTSFTALCNTTYYIRVAQWQTSVAATPWTLNISAPAALDPDGDGVTACADNCPSDPNPSQLDTDGDGVGDACDGCPIDPLKVAPGVCGCGIPDTDTDGDGTPDCIDGCPLDPLKIAAGFCGCGNPETDTDGDGTPDCVDGCPLDPLKIAPGVCGCGTPDTDTDGDGTPDCIDGCPLDPLKIAPGQCGCGIPDTDTDGDGVADCNDNCPTLANPGQEDCDTNGLGDVCEIAGGFQTDCDLNGIPDNCDPDCNSNGNTDACDITAGTSFDLNLNGVPDECEAINGVRYCFGDGSGVACPCGNASLPGEGCANSTGRGGLLYNAGGTSVFLDNAAPLAIQLKANKPSMFITGGAQMNGGLGAVLFDGLLCVAPPIRRYTPQVVSPTGTAVLTQPVFNAGNVMLPGSTWHFQVWYRDNPTSPCSTNANLSNGLSITFTP